MKPAQEIQYIEVKLPGFSSIMSRDWEGTIFQFKARMEVKRVLDCFICMILLQSPIFKIFKQEDTALVHTSDVCCHSFSHLQIRLPFLFPSLCVPSSTSLFSNYFPYF